MTITKSKNERPRPRLRQHSRFLLLACHPDRNPAHADTATAVTQALLALRTQAAAGDPAPRPPGN